MTKASYVQAVLAGVQQAVKGMVPLPLLSGQAAGDDATLQAHAHAHASLLAAGRDHSSAEVAQAAEAAGASTGCVLSRRAGRS